ncbi:MAG: histidine phosphatase family protein [Aggregatilineales bacterium]
MEVYLIRHAQSYNNAVGEENRVEDPPLTEVGQQQAQLLANYFETQSNIDAIVTHNTESETRHERAEFGITHLYTSAMHRTLQTSLPLSKVLGLTPQIWVDTHEIGGIYLEKDGLSSGFGGITRSRIESEFAGYHIPNEVTEAGWWNAERGQEARIDGLARALRVADALRRRAAIEEHQHDRVALVSHGAFLDKLLKAFAERLPGDGYFQWLYNTSITRVDIGADGFIMTRYVNRIGHLPPELVT